MAHILKTGTSILKAGVNIFKVKDKFSYTFTQTSTNGTYQQPACIAFDPVVANNRFLVVNRVSSVVYVINATTMTLVRTLSGFDVPNGIVYDPNPSNNRFFVSNNGNSKSVSIVNATTFAITSTIPGFIDPTGVAYQASSNKLYVTNRSAGTISVYDLTIGNIVTTLSGVIGAYGIHIDPNNDNRLAVCGYDNSQVYIIDIPTLSITNTISINSPVSVQFDPIASNNRLIIASFGSPGLFILNGTAFGITSNIPGISSPVGIAFDLVATNNRFIISSWSSSELFNITQSLS